MKTIGIIGLDTSHPERFAALLSERDDVTVGAVWDAETVRTPSYVKEFCERHDATRVEEPEDMLPLIDAAMVLTVDWNTHARLAQPFLRAGLPVLVDKPLAGRIADIEALAAARKEGEGAIFGGSALPFHPEFESLINDRTETLYCAGCDDPFYYGVHLVDSLRRIVGTDWSRVEPLDSSQAVTVHLEGASATIHFDGGAENSAFAALEIGSSAQTAYVSSNSGELTRMYEPYLDRFLEQPNEDDAACLFDATSLLLATQASLNQQKPITPDSSALAGVSVESAEFVADYSPYY